LSQNYPNPFNPKTNFTLSLPSAGHYKISIYNLLGEAVRTFEGEAAAGHQNFIWDGTDSRGKNVSSGLYFYKAEVGKFTVTKKMMLLR
ncbi:MAG: T9SS type A sorting domain-containing protein, partial [candidate division Zixibacteria bacterium]|nr:T9SS type A sorting domain-containing protein [candidate division Zixibacteria bacterium]